MPDEVITPAVDSRLRRLAQRKGYILRRSRRAIGHHNAGGYMIVDPDTGFCVDGWDFDCGPDYVEGWLKDDD